MVDRPIIFSAPMVRALLDGRKTQTRRLTSSPLAKVAPGDRLWVRENYWHAPSHMGFDATHGCLGHVAYSADPSMTADAKDRARAYGVRQRPSIHMPRWASRITLTVTDVRRERLREISREDVAAEGAVFDPEHRHTTADGSGPPMVKIRVASWATGTAWYADLWDSLHGAGAWEANPEVVALTFTVAQRNIDAEAPHA